MEKTIDRFVADMKTQFYNFTPFIASRVEAGLLKGAFETLRQHLNDPKNKDGKASLKLPFGTINVDIRTKNDVDNVNIGIDFSDDFKEALKGQVEGLWLDTYDELFMKNFADYVSYGFFDPDSEEHKKMQDQVTRSLRMKESERNYFPPAWTNSVVNLVKDHQRDGKTFTLDIDATWDMGSFTFEYKDDVIIPSYTPSKVAKLYLKNGDTVELVNEYESEEY